MNDSKQDAIIRAVQRLTVAVWALVIVLVAWAGMYAAGAFFPVTLKPSGASSASSPESPGMSEESRAFFDAPTKQKVRESTAIVLTRYEKYGSKLRCPISEILKQAPGIEFYFSVGDEIGWCELTQEIETRYGDGHIVFFQGNPAQPRFGTSYSGDRIVDGNIPIEKTREMIKAEAK